MTPVIPEGDALKQLWACFTDIIETTSEGKFKGRVVHAASSADTTGFIDGYSCLITQSERESGSPSVDSNVWMNQVLSPLSIYSPIRKVPYLGASCRLGATFIRKGSVGTFELKCIDSSVEPFVLTFGSGVFTFKGPFESEVDLLSISGFKQAVIKQDDESRYLTKKFDLFITAKLLNPPVTSPRASYQTKVFLSCSNKVFELYDHTRTLNWKERYNAKFNCYSRI
jgi:hypothetical protein